MAEDPPWLLNMQMATGTKEGEDEDLIVGAIQSIGDVFPEQAAYANTYTNDGIAWCGAAVAWALSKCPEPIEASWGPTDTDRWMWAQSYMNWGQPCIPMRGAIMVFTREGGGHVSLYEGETSSTYKVRGGNQSDSVNLAEYSKSSFLGARWPSDYEMSVPGPDEMPTIEEGDDGAAVMEAQRLIGGLDADGDFGPATDAATQTFQRAKSLAVDGVIGPATWEALYEGSPLTPTGKEICELALASDLAKVSWRDRGKAPQGYVMGMALVYYDVFQRRLKDEVVKPMGSPLGSADKDVLAWFDEEIADVGWPLGSADERLRALWAILIGLGMRESSGRFCEGRDMSASNTSSDTAEAGLFQTSYNAHGANSQMDVLFERWAGDEGQGCRLEFAKEVTGSKDEWGCYGSGNGALYQAMSKIYPQFHAEFTAIGLRFLRQHWGPVNRNEVELRDEAYELLVDLENLEGGIEPEPPDDEAVVTVIVPEGFRVVRKPRTPEGQVAVAVPEGVRVDVQTE